MNRLPVKSSNILSLAYDVKSATLEIEFKGNKTSGPKVYQYYEVPAYVYDDLIAGGFGSIGRYFREAVVKSGYRYEEVKGDKDEPDPIAA